MRWLAPLLAMVSLVAAEPVDQPLHYAGSTTIGGLLSRVVPGSISIEAAGSDTALIALAEQRAAVVGLSREPKAEELAAMKAQRGTEPHVQRLGMGAVALFVSRHNPVTGLTRAQLADACAGHQTWGALGVTGPLADQPVQVVVNHPQSGSTRLLTDLVLGGTLPPTVRIELVGSSVVQAAAVDDGVLAIASLHQDTPAVHPVAIDGIMPTPTTIADGTYALTRPMLLLWIPGTPGIARIADALARDDVQRQLVDEGVYGSGH